MWSGNRFCKYAITAVLTIAITILYRTGNVQVCNELSAFNIRSHNNTSTSPKSPFLTNCTADDCNPVRIIHQLALSGPRLYLHDFEFNSLLFEAQKVNTSQVWLRHSTPEDFANIDDVVFIIMSSSVIKSKAKNLVDSWLQMTKNFYFFTDQNDSTIPNFMTLPELINKPTYADAQHRQLRGMKWLRANKPDISSKNWFALVDDDTWLNIPALLHFLHPYSPDLPVVFGYAVDDQWKPGKVFQNGGSGVVLSRNAFEQLADNLYTTTLNFDTANDVTISNGCKALGILMVHSDKLYLDKVTYYRNTLYPPNYVGKISFHNANDLNQLVRMTCDSALFWKFQLPKNCGIIDRFTQFLKI